MNFLRNRNHNRNPFWGSRLRLRLRLRSGFLWDANEFEQKHAKIVKEMQMWRFLEDSESIPCAIFCIPFRSSFHGKTVLRFLMDGVIARHKNLKTFISGAIFASFCLNFFSGFLPFLKLVVKPFFSAVSVVNSVFLISRNSDGRNSVRRWST